METIKAAIQRLAEPERPALAEWFAEFEEQAWDAEMERAFSPGGRGRHLVEKINQEIDRGKFTPLVEGLRSRQGKH